MEYRSSNLSLQVKGKLGLLLITYESPGYEYKCCTLNLTFVVQVCYLKFCSTAFCV
jgi:hypothetical protein